MPSDHDIRGVQTPDPVVLPDDVITDGSASAAEFAALLRESVLAGRSAAGAAVTASESALALAEASAPPTVHRGVSQLPLIEAAGVSVYEFGGARGGDLFIERIALTWGPSAPVTGDQLFAVVYTGAPGSRPDGPSPDNLLRVDTQGVDPLSFAGLGAVIVFEPVTPYYVAPSSALLLLVAPSPMSAVVQWREEL